MNLYQKGLVLERKKLLEGPHAEHFQKLCKFLDQMTLNDAGILIDAVKDSVWLSETDQRAKNDALRLIDNTIIKLREEAGLAPFDDSLMGEPPNAYLVIRKILTGVGNL